MYYNEFINSKNHECSSFNQSWRNTETYPLKNIKAAQEDFLRKKYSGKLVLIPTNDNI